MKKSKLCYALRDEQDLIMFLYWLEKNNMIIWD